MLPAMRGLSLRAGLPACLLGVCIGLLAACDDDPTVAEADAGVHGLQVVVQGEPAWLGVTALTPTDVWFVGGTQQPPSAAIGHFDGALTSETLDGPTLWWVFGLDAEHLWACGAGGRILRHQADNTWVPEATDATADTVLWGLWGSGPTDLWAVGGTDVPGGPRGVVLRSAGDGQWTRVLDPTLPLEDPADEFAGLNLYKVWGAGPDAVYLVGEGGRALHWDGQQFRTLPTETTEILFTVHGRPNGPVLAVGGLTSGVVRRLEGDRFVPEAIPTGPVLNGIFVRPDGTALATGAQGLVLARDVQGQWTRLRPPADNAIGARTLHAVVDSGDGTWAVGGDLSALRDGVVTTDRPTVAPARRATSAPGDAP